MCQKNIKSSTTNKKISFHSKQEIKRSKTLMFIIETNLSMTSKSYYIRLPIVSHSLTLSVYNSSILSLSLSLLFKPTYTQKFVQSSFENPLCKKNLSFLNVCIGNDCNRSQIFWWKLTEWREVKPNFAHRAT